MGKGEEVLTEGRPPKASTSKQGEKWLVVERKRKETREREAYSYSLILGVSR